MTSIPRVNRHKPNNKSFFQEEKHDIDVALKGQRRSSAVGIAHAKKERKVKKGSRRSSCISKYPEDEEKRSREDSDEYDRNCRRSRNQLSSDDSSNINQQTHNNCPSDDDVNVIESQFKLQGIKVSTEKDRNGPEIDNGKCKQETTIESPFSIVKCNHDQLTQCSIVRCKSGSKILHPEYNLYFGNKLILKAQKKIKNRTSNYHIFDMARGFIGSKLSKKCGNYIGKLRSNFSRTDNVMVGNHLDRSELGAVYYKKPTSDDEPRQLVVVLPGLDENGAIEPLEEVSVFSGLLDKYRNNDRSDTFILETKMPEYESGSFRLNFSGRVSIPSIKNFQLVSPLDNDNLLLQFGKVSADKFILDFKQPLTPFQAFSIALCQFNY